MYFIEIGNLLFLNVRIAFVLQGSPYLSTCVATVMLQDWEGKNLELCFAWIWFLYWASLFFDFAFTILS